ncbi:MAG: NAD(P)/FAD-dependent oxidoreductase [Bacteroidetes bacterium]|nr:NAD(P)/FAD-dependent oxidoreductase [Bacteroidota bacterium]
MSHKKYPRVVIIGAGFAGLNAAKKLANQPFEVIIIDKTNHHLFQPLLYQVASAALSPGDIASPIRTILRGIPNVYVEMDEVVSIDKVNKIVILSEQENIEFDYLIVAPGTRHSYFSNPEWEQFAPGLKSLDDALKIREKVLLSFEKAEHLVGSNEANRHLTFVIVGGGPTGVEIAGSLAEIGSRTMLPDFPMLNKKDIKIYLVEATNRILSSFPESLSEKARQNLETLGVRVLLNARVANITENDVEISWEHHSEIIETTNVIWGAGNAASPLLKTLNSQLDKSGRAIVNSDCSLPNYPNIFVVGDAACFTNNNGDILPGVAQTAIQQGHYVASNISRKIQPENRKPFVYNDKGIMATIGRAKAIAQIGKLKFHGIIAWLLWAVIHVISLIGFRNQFRVMTEWIWYYFTFNPGARLIIRSKLKKDNPK